MILNKTKDIRTTRIKKINELSFYECLAGHKPFRKFSLTCLAVFAALLCSILTIISGGFLIGSSYYFINDTFSIFIIALIINIFLLNLALITLRGFELATLSSIVTLIIGSGIIAIPFEIKPGIWGGLLFLSFSIATAWLAMIALGFSLTVTLIVGGALGELIAFLGVSLLATQLTILSTADLKISAEAKHTENVVTALAAIAVILTSAIIARKAVKGDPKFTWIREKAVFWAAIGGTSFYGADLTDACFDGADLPHTDFRKTILTRTSFEGATRLDLSRLQGTILEQPKVRKLLVTKIGDGEDYTGSNFVGANLRGANLTGAILKEVKALDADFSGATLTGACIENWSINSETRFTAVQCDYIYRELDEKGKPTARYPVDRNFEPGEFESLFQQVGNVVELIFKEGLDWRALSFSFRKLQLDDEGLGLELRGVEKRGDLWVVKVAYKEGLARPMVEQRVSTIYDDIKNLLAVKEQQINKLLGIASDQAEALKNQSRQPFGNNFVIFGSTITNLAGSGQIDYDEAASKIRSIVANSADIGQVAPIAQNLLQQLQTQSVATSSDKQVELIQQVILTEAKKDPFFKQFLVQQSQQIMEAMPEKAITLAIRNAIAQLNQPLP